MCPYCNRPLMKIDHYGEMPVGCIDCNRWGYPCDDTLIMELLESATSKLVKANRQQCCPGQNPRSAEAAIGVPS